MTPQSLTRKVLTPVSPREICRNRRNNVPSRSLTALNGTTGTAGGRRSLSSAQLNLASYLAFTCPHSQRKHSGLLAEMERKRNLQQDKEAHQMKETQPEEISRSQGPNYPPTPRSVKLEPVFVLQQHPACGPNWRVRAEARLKRAKISLDKEWSSKTWSNKTNVPERLFLLEEDGFDITPLQRTSVSSAQVTEVIMSRIEERKEQDRVLNAPKLQTPRDLSRLANAVQLLAESVTAHTPPAESSSETAPDTLEYSPAASADRKRKRDHGGAMVGEPHVVATSYATKWSDEKSPKRIRVRTPKEVESDIRGESWVLFRKNVVREIFKHPRCRSFAACKPSLARIIFRFPSSRDEDRNPHATSDRRLHISSRGYENIVNEIRFLAHHQPEQTRGNDFYIFDPDFENKHTSTDDLVENRNLKVSDNNHTKGKRESQRRIHLSSTDTQCVIAGDTCSLEGLLRRLQENHLLHTTEWTFNGLTIAPRSNITWSLSNKTQSLLAEIRERLQGGGGDDVREVNVDWVYVGETRHV